MYKKGKGREGAGWGVRWSRQMVGGCVSNQPGDRGESSNTKSREILTIIIHISSLQAGLKVTVPPPLTINHHGNSH